MSFVPPDLGERSLTEVLAFICEEDGCSRTDAWKQFCQMAAWSRKWLWSVVWADRRPPPKSLKLPITQPWDNVGPFGGWDDAKLEDDDSVRFAKSRARRITIVPWQNFRAMWKAGQLRGVPLESPARGSRPPSREKPFWPDAHRAIFEWLIDQGCPEPGDGGQANIERFTAGWLEARGHKAGETTIRRHVARCITKRRAELNA